jgi:primosomal protein N'
MTATMDCPWCSEPTTLNDDEDHVACEACGVSADLAPASLAQLAEVA